MIPETSRAESDPGRADRQAGRVLDLGVAAYDVAYQKQLELVGARQRGEVEDTLVLVEHPHVITVGRAQKAKANVVAAGDVEVVEVERGGDVTYHGPGQLMVYPVVRLRRGLVAFLEAIAGALAATAAALGVEGCAWQRDPAGLWLDGAKLAACGIHLRRGVVAHGWAFDVATPAAMWALIQPCGLSTPVISLATARARRGLGAPPDVAPDVAMVAELAGPRLVGALDRL